MMVLVAGASGATGRLLVEQLLARGLEVKAIVRAPDKLPDRLRAHAGLSVIHASLLDLADAELALHVHGCDAVASCLGHNLSLRGMYGHPRMLVTDATRRLCSAIKANGPKQPVKFVLMNTAGNRNRDAGEPITSAEQCVTGAIRVLLPPHLDNERAADFLRTRVGPQDDVLEWVVVRPDSLTDEGAVTDYVAHPSPIRSAIFDPGKTSRVNVAHFMTELITDDAVWTTWRGQMPVIYNRDAAT
jgi:NAD(P)-dependent dehydrogenase (short-subunit alcohol dehydrogenase family)